LLVISLQKQLSLLKANYP